MHLVKIVLTDIKAVTANAKSILLSEKSVMPLTKKYTSKKKLNTPSIADI
jgi:hypothetical protein